MNIQFYTLLYTNVYWALFSSVNYNFSWIYYLYIFEQKSGTLFTHKKIYQLHKIELPVICTYWLSGRAGRENILLEVHASWRELNIVFCGGVCISSRAFHVFPALSSQCVRPSYGNFFLMIFQGNCAQGRRGHMINKNYLLTVLRAHGIWFVFCDAINSQKYHTVFH